MKKAIFSAIALGFLTVACGGGGEQKQQKEEKPKVQLQQGSEEEEEDRSDIPESVELSIEGNDQMKYNKEKLTAYAGQEVTLTLKHVGEMALEAMGHNVVILAKGTDVADFAADAVAAGLDANHIPEDRKDEIIAHTGLVGGGDETTITFTAPEKGTYDFICSFPGHYGMMKGKFNVK